MNQFKKKMYDLSGPKTAEALNKRRFEAYYCSTAEEAVEKALELIPREDTVSWGGCDDRGRAGAEAAAGAGGLYAP